MDNMKKLLRQRYFADEKLSAEGGIRAKITGLKLFPRWAIWFALLFYVVLLGEYGPGYSAAEFIYRGF